MTHQCPLMRSEVSHEPDCPHYIETIPSPAAIRQDIGRLFTALQAARRLLKVSEHLHDDGDRRDEAACRIESARK